MTQRPTQWAIRPHTLRLIRHSCRRAASVLLIGLWYTGCASGTNAAISRSSVAVEAPANSRGHPIYVMSHGQAGPIFWLQSDTLRLPAELFDGASSCTPMVSDTFVYLWCPIGSISLSVIGCHPYSYEANDPPPVSFGVTLQNDSELMLVLDCAQAQWPIGPRQ